MRSIFMARLFGIRLAERSKPTQRSSRAAVGKCDCGRTLWARSEIETGYCATCRHQRESEEARERRASNDPVETELARLSTGQ